MKALRLAVIALGLAANAQAGEPGGALRQLRAAAGPEPGPIAAVEGAPVAKPAEEDSLEALRLAAAQSVIIREVIEAHTKQIARGYEQGYSGRKIVIGRQLTQERLDRIMVKLDAFDVEIASAAFARLREKVKPLAGQVRWGWLTLEPGSLRKQDALALRDQLLDCLVAGEFIRSKPLPIRDPEAVKTLIAAAKWAVLYPRIVLSTEQVTDRKFLETMEMLPYDLFLKIYPKGPDR